MILILSTRHDINTNGVIEWLRHFNTPFFRLNDEDILNGDVQISFNLSENSFVIKGVKKINLQDIKVVWFRKFGFLKSYDNFFSTFDETSNLKNYSYSEFDRIRKLLFKLLEDKKWLYNKKNMPSKVEVLILAQKKGLKTPKTIITNNKSDILNTFSKDEEIITKSLGEATRINFLNTSTPLLTQKFRLKELKNNKFFPSLFQKYVDKKFELRIFYLSGDFYSMAMFTQKNSKTSIDFRNYDYDRPPRRIPYQLPKNIETMLDDFMRELGVNTGSIDMIYTKDNEYVFLEVNPTGQFGMTSVPCNYPIDLEVAKFLKNSLN
jgi:ATP-GRASP peptide maturase of grasp-with-spasm system